MTAQFVFALAGIALQLAAATTYDVRNTTEGEVRGLLNETSGCRSWRGVFFAADTGGSNRFQAPQPREAWAPNVADATAFAAGCSQVCATFEFMGITTGSGAPCWMRL